MRTAALGTAASGLAAPAVLAQSPIVMKMQTSWPASDIWMDFAREYVVRVEEMSGGRLKVDLLPAGAVVGAFQVLDGVNDGVIDSAHTVAAYWYGKHKGASLFGTGPVFGGTATTMLGWFYQGGGAEFYRELTQDILGLNVYRLLRLPDAGTAPRLVQGRGEHRGRPQRLQVPHRRPSRQPDAAARHERLAAAGRRDRTGDGARRDRRLRVQQPVVGPTLRLAGRGEELLSRLLPPGSECFEFTFNKDFFDDLDPDLQAILKYGVEAASTSNTALALQNYSSDLVRLQDEMGVTVHRTSQDILDAELTAWEELVPELEQDEYIKRVLDSQRAWVERVSFYELMNAPDYVLAYNHAFPGKLKA